MTKNMFSAFFVQSISFYGSIQCQSKFGMPCADKQQQQRKIHFSWFLWTIYEEKKKSPHFRKELWFDDFWRVLGLKHKSEAENIESGADVWWFHKILIGFIDDVHV